MGTYHRTSRVALVPKADELPFDLPESVVVSLKELAGACKEGLLALAVGTGMQVMHALIEANVTAIAGPKGKHNPERNAVRHGSDPGSVTLGGRRVPVERPRVRTPDKRSELPVPVYDFFAKGDALGGMAVERMLAGLSARRYTTGLEPIGTDVERIAKSTSKSAISRRFVALTKTALADMFSRRLDDLDIVALMVDGVHVGDHLCVVALGIDMDGHKHALGLWEGATENTTVVTTLLDDLVDRGLDASKGPLVVIDGGKALPAGIRRVFGAKAVIQRCQEHKIRNVTGHLPKDEQDTVERAMRAAYSRTDAARAQRELEQPAARLERTHPGAAGSLREGLEETLTVVRLGLSGALMRTLRSTNPVESMISRARDVARNVKRVRDGAMALRWTAAGLAEAKESFRRIRGYRDLSLLRAALSKQVHAAVDNNSKAA